ncbi:MAG: DUF5615 family PIN-like protein [Propionibacteriaceae bacterium]|jgi:hypothetical protein|nr:DUF5615 family PIN-like protein [Propionibacteriaceae bacterium]
MGEVKLLLDEHYPPTLAESLSGEGIDAVCVTRRGDLRGKDDYAVLLRATDEGRLVVTEDVNTFGRAIALLPHHAGVVFCHSLRFPRTAGGLRLLQSALTEFARTPPVGVGEPGFVWWLPAP